MSAGEETARTVLQVTSKAAVITMQTILKAMERAKQTGEQSLQSLSAKNVPLDKIPVSNVDIKAMKDILKEYGIDFAVVKDKGTQDFTLYFKGTDTVAITTALEEVLKANGLDKDRDRQSDLTEAGTEPLDSSEMIHNATQRAEQVNQKTVSRAAERSMGEIPKPKGTEQNL